MGKLVVITGPTGVGKTELGIDLARFFDTPIINADSRQMFRGMSIGTAAPTKEQLQAVKHYFVATLNLTDYYNAAMFERDALKLIHTLFNKDKNSNDVVLLCGGSMMYIDAVCNGIDEMPTIDAELRESLKQRLANEGLAPLLEELRKHDPDYYESVDRNNWRRVVHGLEICLQTGRTYTSFRKRATKPRDFKIVKICISLPREQLYDRINSRVDSMMERGLLDEAQSLYPMRHLNALNTVGYKELFDHFDGHYTLEEAVERIKGNTRRYARKQLTWFKRDPAVAWFTPYDKDAIIKHIIQA